ncbi:cation:proton antiporter [bacterium]|nr:cation:proton antiporter [bacterium]
MEHSPTHDMLITMVTAISAGVILIAISKLIRTSAIVLLLIGGMLLGPEFLDIIKPESLGDGLRVIVSLAVGLILFEGGLTLDLEGYRSASKLIRRLLSLGILTTLLATAVAIHLTFDKPWNISFLAASLVIVTGPTVIAPLLKRIKINTKLHNILHWEGVLIDPLGVFVALLFFEWIIGQGSTEVLSNFILRFISGIAIGLAGGFGIYQLLKSRLIPEDMMNVTSLALAVLIFGITDTLFTEAGLLAVTVAGFVLGVKRPVELKQIRHFKAEITDLLIGMLFMLLAARLKLSQFSDFGWQGVLLVAIVMIVVRPLNILISSVGLDFNWREKAFLGWVAPRGIVAASMASYITIRLQAMGRFEQPQFIETFTYSVITATVLIQGFTAGPFASLLQLKRPAPTGWMIIGAHPLGRRIARFIERTAKLPAVLIDTNPRAVNEARNDGLNALILDAREAEVEDRDDFQSVGNLIALTDNEELNVLLCQRWAAVVGRDHVYRWTSGKTKAREAQETPGRAVWTGLPKPSLLSAELQRGEASIIHSHGDIIDPGNLTTPLLAAQNKQLIIDPGAAKKDASGQAQGERLYLRREADYLVRSLRPELVTRVEAKDIDHLFEQMIEIVIRLFPKVPKDETLSELQEREKSFPTALGHGIAVPHAYSHALESRVCAVAQIPGGVDFNAPDGEPVRLAFLLLSPTGDPEGHLATMAEIARLVVDKQTRQRLMDAEDPADVLIIVNRVNTLLSQPPGSRSGSSSEVAKKR